MTAAGTMAASDGAGIGADGADRTAPIGVTDSPPIKEGAGKESGTARTAPAAPGTPARAAGAAIDCAHAS